MQDTLIRATARDHALAQRPHVAPPDLDPDPTPPFGQEWQLAYWARKCGATSQQLARAAVPASDHDIAVVEWVERCAARLGMRQPYLSPVQALTRAIELHEQRSHIRPEHAAELEFSDWPLGGI